MIAYVARILAALALVSASLGAAAQEFRIGAGYSHYERSGAENGATLTLAYRHSPFHENGRFSASFGAALDAQDTGDIFGGAGVMAEWQLGRGWFLEASVLPGAYAESIDLHDLGSTFEIRSLLGLGRRFENGTAVSLALSHKSNASTAEINPGLNALHLIWHLPLAR